MKKSTLTLGLMVIAAFNFLAGVMLGNMSMVALALAWGATLGVLYTYERRDGE